MASDFTDAKNRLEDIQRMAEDARVLIDDGNSVIVGVDKHLNITDWNKKMVA